MKELEKLKQIIESDFCDPFNDDSLKNFLLGKSKLIRSKLAVLYLKAHEKEISDSVYNILAAGEIIHNASLLHDDVLDEASVRRGVSTLGKKFTPKISILSGDYLVAYAIEKLLILNNEKIINTFKDAIKSMCEAEIKQYFSRGSKPDLNTYLEICKGKTASLFAAILHSCAYISGINSEKAELFGINFGILFQIMNDLDEESAKSDKKNGIYTAKDFLGIEKTALLSDNYRKEIRVLLQDCPDNKYKRELEDLCLIKKDSKPV